VTSDLRPWNPSAWVTAHARLIPAGSAVLDVACGSGRHTRWFLERGHPVVAVDRDLDGVADLRGRDDCELVEADLETGAAPPFAGREFGGVIVTNYLHRPLLPALVAAVAPGGAFLYETFARGNERLGHVTNPDFLLEPGELLDAVRGLLRVVAYEDVVVDEPRPAAVQRVAAVRQPATTSR
jgi:SAM-dependent methyltransferase